MAKEGDGQECNLCRAIVSGMPHDSPVIESELFHVCPDIGGFLIGWILLFPKRCVPSFFDLQQHEFDEMDRLISEIWKLLGNRYDGYDIVLFDHGRGGYSVKHAHLHAVPIPKISGQADSFPRFEMKLKEYGAALEVLERTQELTTQLYRAPCEVKDNEPGFVQWGLGSNVYEIKNIKNTQLFRQLVALFISDWERFEWRENAVRTRKELLSSQGSNTVSHHE